MKFRMMRAAGVATLSLLLVSVGYEKAARAPAPAPSGGTAPVVNARVPEPIGGVEAHRLVADGAFLLDVRTPGEFSPGHAEGAVNIPISQLEGRLSELPRDRIIITYCASGARSRAAATLLRSEHFDVRDLRTLSAWNQ
jgi:rhodanese-related sulfurtransferase